MRPARAGRCIAVLMACSACAIMAEERHAGDVASFDKAVKAAAPGDAIVLQNGEWKDADLLLIGQGTAEQPITLRAEEPGKMVLTGHSRLRIAGGNLVVQGLWFRDIPPGEGDVIEFRKDSKTPAHDCRLINCAITQEAPLKDETERKWVSLYGKGNHVERCHFAGKTSPGALMVVWLQAEEAAHHISANYFGPRQPLGRNGGETLRVGDSAQSMTSAKCVIERNFFEHCDGELECISNKSCDNLYTGNVFRECRGTLTLRHGNRCTIQGNWFLGNHRKDTAGIRIIGEEHVITGNYLEALEGEDTRAAICVMNGIPHSPLSGYFQPKHIDIAGNIVVDCRQSLVIGQSDKKDKATLPPLDLAINGNIFWSAKRRIIFQPEPKATIAWGDNLAWGADLGIPNPGSIGWHDPKLTRDADDLWRMSPETPMKNEVMHEGLNRQLPIKRDETGVKWLQPRS